MITQRLFIVEKKWATIGLLLIHGRLLPKYSGEKSQNLNFFQSYLARLNHEQLHVTQKVAQLGLVYFLAEFIELSFPCRTGPNKWRDMQLPSEILDAYCEKRCLGKPRYNGDTFVRVDHKDYTLEESGWFSIFDGRGSAVS